MPPFSLRAWLHAKAVDPLVARARAGASPRSLARAAGVGFAVGLCPLLGAPLPILLALLLAARCASIPLNPAALLIGNAMSFPAVAALLVPYVRLGARVTRTPLPPLSPADLRRALWSSPRELASVVGGALLCWAVSVPVVAAVVARVSEPFLAALAAGGGTSPPPAAAAGAAGRRGGDDVERAPLRARGG